MHSLPSITVSIAIAINVVLASGCAELGDELETSTTTSEITAPEPCNGCWIPSVDARWQYQLQGNTQYPATGGINVNIDAVPASGGARVRPQVFDIDLYESELIHGRTDVLNTNAVAAIHANQARAICYVSAGSFENWRPDAGDYPSSVKGRKNGWPGEVWVDIRQLDILGPIMARRADKCKLAGFDAIEWDNVDGYANRTGFPLTAANQLDFNTLLAKLAHERGLSVALKNDTRQLAALKGHFDFAINEECFRYRECDYPAPGYPDWTASGKAVFNVEYRSINCTRANAWNFSSIRKSVDLFDTPYTPCR